MFGTPKALARQLCRVAWVLVLLAASAVSSYAQTGPYSQQQAVQGQHTFNAHCSQCHGADLQGQSGPALAGPQFKSSLEFSKMSGKQLFNFISKQMPYDDPGSLSQDEYLNVMAYLLSRNNYPAGHGKLTEADLGEVHLLPYPSHAKEHASSEK